MRKRKFLVELNEWQVSGFRSAIALFLSDVKVVELKQRTRKERKERKK